MSFLHVMSAHNSNDGIILWLGVFYDYEVFSLVNVLEALYARIASLYLHLILCPIPNCIEMKRKNLMALLS